MEEKTVSKRYFRELSEIKNKLNDLKNERIYELSKTKNDGYLRTNIEQLEKLLEKLFFKIDNDAPSVDEELREAVNSAYKSND
ncbi:hypothetical protein FO510_05705 [Bacillus pumilus]|uniref:hypothetical protein n=1 Tax=Bacillus pumilus TaxID=1408 RepID=UPI00017A5ED9|nr:hypothetical protein [Bacillus pumilus]EDW22158.1 conserved hypothetical protein [Bacillus pumilus ATCC 7061]MCR4352136.1 hypothetical protein [Bacillus pumilus]MCY7503947.1 hypothetical protein [Bacillus pumilus]MDR4269060.1 hypothetical protein [Bacillus pumilus]MDR4269147.1 hypothetical protein [Bacillus pumilus]